MLKLCQWLKLRWFLPFYILTVTWEWVRYRDRKNPFEAIKIELKAIRAASEAADWKARLGVERAKAMVRNKYYREIVKLEATQPRLLRELEQNPVALVKFLVRIVHRIGPQNRF